MNDVYELMPLDDGLQGGLARVATIKHLLEDENPYTFAILAGDLISPSALSTCNVSSTPGEPKSLLQGRQMVDTMNHILDYATFGNHEFDYSYSILQQRISLSNFKWISTNVNSSATKQAIPNTFRHIIRNIPDDVTKPHVRVLLFGLTIANNLGKNNYVSIVNDTNPLDFLSFVNDYLVSLNGQYDICIAITHLELVDDMLLAEYLPQIDIIMGKFLILVHEAYFHS